MTKSGKICITIGCLMYLSLAIAHAGGFTFASTAEQTNLIELYTSEGCSSCPPADKWLSQFKTDAGLWQKIVPVAFHVDYWDYLGWKDPFSDSRFSARQRRYAIQRNISTVYTPGLIKNGREWRGWYKNPAIDSNSTVVGVLKVSIDKNKIRSTFDPKKAKFDQLQLTIALLGFDLITHVQSGENEGKKLAHDFVILRYETVMTNAEKQGTSTEIYQWEIDNSISSTPNASGIAVWVSALDDQSPIQATGTWLTLN